MDRNAQKNGKIPQKPGISCGVEVLLARLEGVRPAGPELLGGPLPGTP
jgi:hypothetical protein